MQREIKFRAWDRNKKLMYEITLLDLPQPDDQYKSIELLQYTGLKDKRSIRGMYCHLCL